MTKIYETDTPEQTAEKIYKYFDVHDSATIAGYWDIGDLIFRPKGELVCDELRRLDRLDNMKPVRGGAKINRIRRRPPDSIGGYLAQKIFRYKKVDCEPPHHIKFQIWRIQ